MKDLNGPETSQSLCVQLYLGDVMSSHHLASVG